MYRFEYQEGLDNLIVYSGKGGLLTACAADSGGSEVTIFHIPKQDLVDLLALVVRLVAEGSWEGR